MKGDIGIAKSSLTIDSEAGQRWRPNSRSKAIFICVNSYTSPHTLLTHNIMTWPHSGLRRGVFLESETKEGTVWLAPDLYCNLIDGGGKRKQHGFTWLTC